jgi:hypothetical protein
MFIVFRIELTLNKNAIGTWWEKYGNVNWAPESWYLPVLLFVFCPLYLGISWKYTTTWCIDVSILYQKFFSLQYSSLRHVDISRLVLMRKSKLGTWKWTHICVIVCSFDHFITVSRENIWLLNAFKPFIFSVISTCHKEYYCYILYNGIPQKHMLPKPKNVA